MAIIIRRKHTERVDFHFIVRVLLKSKRNRANGKMKEYFFFPLNLNWLGWRWPLVILIRFLHGRYLVGSLCTLLLYVIYIVTQQNRFQHSRRIKLKVWRGRHTTAEAKWNELNRSWPFFERLPLWHKLCLQWCVPLKLTRKCNSNNHGIKPQKSV